MKSLVIGNTSQLSYYFPEDYDRISSRNINYQLFNDNHYDSVYLLFAEQRTFIGESESFFTNVNVDYTLDVINKIKNKVNKIIIFSTAELWNNCDGGVTINTPYKYNYTPYIKSKEILCNVINNEKDKYTNVHIIYPFNFNSPYRKTGFLFSKIFKSLINNVEISIGDINFKRDLLHPSIIVKHSINITKDIIVGSGELINVEKFIKDLYIKCGLNYVKMVKKDVSNTLLNKRKEYHCSDKLSNYAELLYLTYGDIKKNKAS
jgi:nucleoside-diphosphate-sugar epimerase